jgi:two-component system sensor histidine kinase TctE
VGNSQVILIVEDNGPGLSDTQSEQAFDRFWRGSDLPGGCGLGLSIVQEISKRHGGEVDLDKAGTHGLVVRLKFRECP